MRRVESHAVLYVADIVNVFNFTLFHSDFIFTYLAQSIRDTVQLNVHVEPTVYETLSRLEDHSAVLPPETVLVQTSEIFVSQAGSFHIQVSFVHPDSILFHVVGTHRHAQPDLL